MKVRFTRRSVEDLVAIANFIWDRNRQAALDVELAVSRTAAQLAEFPMLGIEDKDLGVRKLLVPRYPYAIYYTIDRDEVWIVHIRDGRRRPPEIDDVRLPKAT